MRVKHEEGPPVMGKNNGFNRGNILLPIAILALLHQNGWKEIETSEVIRATKMLKSVKPYFQDKPRELLAKSENILEILNALNRYIQKEYKKETYLIPDIEAIQDKPVKILNAIKPHLKEDGQDKVGRLLLLNDRINRLKNQPKEKRNLVEAIENMVDILEAFRYEKAKDIRGLLIKTKEIVDIINREKQKT